MDHIVVKRFDNHLGGHIKKTFNAINIVALKFLQMFHGLSCMEVLET